MKPDVLCIMPCMTCFILTRYCRRDEHFCDFQSVNTLQKGKMGKKWSDNIIYKGVSQESSPKHTVSERHRLWFLPNSYKTLLCINTYEAFLY